MEYATQPRIRQNLDTSFLKLIAIITMTCDHVGKIFFPDNRLLAVLGRIAFPLFAYCLVVGCLYTRDIKRYALRLIGFAVVSQPLYVFAFHPNPNDFWNYLPNLNILFTLAAGVLLVAAIRDFPRRWWMAVLPVVLAFYPGLDYGTYGIVLIVLFYIGRNSNWVSVAIVVLWLCTKFFVSGAQIELFGLEFAKQGLALLSLPFIYLHTNFGLKIYKYLFYIYYPTHFLVIYMLRVIFKV